MVHTAEQQSWNQKSSQPHYCEEKAQGPKQHFKIISKLFLSLIY